MWRDVSSLRRFRLLAIAIGLIAALSPSVASASLPGNPFADGPFFVDWHWRDENRMVRGDLPLGSLNRAAGQFIAQMPLSKWWPLHDPHGSTYDRLRLFLDRAAEEGGL